MAPSQNLSTRGRTRTSRLALPTALVLASTLALSACGAEQAGSAAIVNGTAISDADVQAIVDQVNSTLPSGTAKATTRDTLLNLIAAPYAIAEAKRAGRAVAPSETRALLAKVEDPSDAMVEYYQLRVVLASLDQTNQAAFVNKVVSDFRKANVKVTVNPRYGTFDVTKFSLAPISPNWIKAAAAAPVK